MHNSPSNILLVPIIILQVYFQNNKDPVNTFLWNSRCERVKDIIIQLNSHIGITYENSWLSTTGLYFRASWCYMQCWHLCSKILL